MKRLLLFFGKNTLPGGLGQIVFMLLLTVTFIACRKTPSNPRKSVFDTHAAKEWYYGTFKKSAVYASYNSRLYGIKSPDWKHGTYKKIGNIEVVEFPLIKIKTSIAVPTDKSLTEEDNKRIAEASLTRIAFFKTGNNIVVREIDYIPEWQYLQTKGFDISHNSTGNLDNDFLGKLIIKKWNGKELSRRILANGTFTGKARIAKRTTPNSANKTTAAECTDFLITEFERTCREYWVGDLLEKESCSEWTPTGNSWVESVCVETNGCNAGLTSEECACEFYGFCNDGGGVDKPQDDEECNERELEWSSSVTEASDLESISTLSESPDTRTKNYVWIFAKGTLNPTLRWKSHETGVHVKDNDVWKWESLTHNNISKEGIVIGGSLECSVNSATSTLGVYNAIMALDYTFTWSFVCKGSPVSGSINNTSAKPFNVNE